MSELHRPRIAILASGGGTTAEAYAQAIHRGEVDHEIGLVVSSNPDAGILERVDRWNDELDFDTEAIVINNETHPGGPNSHGQTHEAAEAITNHAMDRRIDLIATLGYMTIINDPLIDIYGFVSSKDRSIHDARMINTHPGPLPLTQDTMGGEASELVLSEAGRIAIENDRRLMGGLPEIEALAHSEHTMHVVSQIVDDPQTVFARHPVEILPGDTADSLFQRVQWIEKATVPYAIDKFISDRIKMLDEETQGIR